MSRLRTLSLITPVVLIGGFALAAFVAPMDADQGFMQKIFYLHVPLAIVALGGFVFGGVMAIQHLRTDDPAYDLKSYVAIHLALILGVGALLTGSIWARASWGKWWVWDEPTLVSFLIVFLLYATYYPLRYSIEDPERRARYSIEAPERRARYSSVFAITAGAFVPINFLAVRLAESLVHPRVLNQTAGDMPGEMRLTFLVALAGVALLYVTLMKVELTSKHARGQIRRVRRLLEDGERPAAGAAGQPVASVPARPTL